VASGGADQRESEESRGLCAQIAVFLWDHHALSGRASLRAARRRRRRGGVDRGPHGVGERVGGVRRCRRSV